MSLRTRLCITKRKGEGGFTFVETIAALSIVVIVGGAVFLIASASATVGRRVLDAARENRLMVESDRVLRAAVSRIEVPYWSQPFFEQTGTGARIGYLDGQSDSYLLVEIQDGAMKIALNGETELLSGVDSCSIEFETEEEQAPVVVFSIEAASGQAWEIVARVGSW